MLPLVCWCAGAACCCRASLLMSCVSCTGLRMMPGCRCYRTRWQQLQQASTGTGANCWRHLSPYRCVYVSARGCCVNILQAAVCLAVGVGCFYPGYPSDVPGCDAYKSVLAMPICHHVSCMVLGMISCAHATPWMPGHPLPQVAADYDAHVAANRLCNF